MKKLILNLTVLILLLSASRAYAQTEETLFFEDFESGWGNWWADNGVWEIGIPTSGPTSAYSGQNCAGTVLDGYYPSYADTRIISQSIVLPQISGDEKLFIKFRQFYMFDSGDIGKLQVSDNSGNWQNMNYHGFDDQSPVWSQFYSDISDFAGQTIKIAFYFESDNFWENTGWYIDNVSVEKNQNWFANPESFETGMNCWYGDNGQWETGLPIVGPSNAHIGEKCAATILSSNYPSYGNSELISPDIFVPSVSLGEKVIIKFWHWFQFDSGDYGKLQIFTNSQWSYVDNLYFEDQSPGWTQCIIDISSFQNSIINLGFLFVSDNFWENTGWYIDDISLETKTVSFISPEDFELGIGDWQVDNGIWQAGSPNNGPTTSHSGSYCAGTLLNTNYPSHANSRLISPEITIQTNSGQDPLLFFWHWSQFDSGDFGVVQASTDNGYTWSDISDHFDDSNPVWSRTGVYLDQYIGQTIRIAFYFKSDNFWENTGWYIDDISIEGLTSSTEENLNNKISSKNPIGIYPNPFKSKTNVLFSNPNHSNYKLSVFSTTGSKVFEMDNITTNKVEFEKGNLPKGIYLIELNGERVFREKVIIE